MVASNLAGLPDDLVQRRVYMLTIQVDDDHAEVRVFERFSSEDLDGTVATWQDEKMGDLVTQLTEVLIANKGVHCPGEQIKAALEVDREFSISEPAPAPKTAAEAFGPALSAHSGSRFVQATVMALC